MTVNDRLAGVESIAGRYLAYQFYMHADEIRAEEDVKRELILDFVRDKEFVFVANVRHDKGTPSSLFSMQTSKGKIKFGIRIDSLGGKVSIITHNRKLGKIFLLLYL
jgi:hypothetical protein